MTPLEFLETLYRSWQQSRSRSWQWRFRDPRLRRCVAMCVGQTNRRTDSTDSTSA